MINFILKLMFNNIFKLIISAIMIAKKKMVIEIEIKIEIKIKINIKIP